LVRVVLNEVNAHQDECYSSEPRGLDGLLEHEKARHTREAEVEAVDHCGCTYRTQHRHRTHLLEC